MSMQATLFYRRCLRPDIALKAYLTRHVDASKYRTILSVSDDVQVSVLDNLI